jgi:hypothetical protein
VPLLIKTSATCYAALEAAILSQHHPYELPEVIALPVTHGLPEYLAWVADETVRQAAGEADFRGVNGTMIRWLFSLFLVLATWRMPTSSSTRRWPSSRVRAPSTGRRSKLRFAIAEGYYLYRDKFRFAVEPSTVQLGTRFCRRARRSTTKPSATSRCITRRR